MPAGQDVFAKVQDAAPAALYAPAAQLEHGDTPPALNVPAAHAMQEEGGDANVPAGQDDSVKAQSVAPATLYVPAAHADGDAAFVGQKEPAGHAAAVIV